MPTQGFIKKKTATVLLSSIAFQNKDLMYNLKANEIIIIARIGIQFI